jgi:uncharacterized protein with GYD domain
MTTYILLGNYTEQGSRRIRESPARLDKARAILREMGGDFRSFNLTMGRYDFVAVYEAPDDAVSARFTLMLGEMGNVRTETLKAFPESAFREIIHSMGA